MCDLSSSKNNEKFYCNFCDYKSNKKYDYRKHLATLKHKKMSDAIQMLDNASPKSLHCDYVCNCGKIYKHDSSYYRHKKTCKYLVEEKKESTIVSDFIEKQDIHQLIQYLLKENTEFKQLLIDQNKQMIEMSKQTNNITNTQNINSNNHFNLQFFLNETCKDAMNINDFVSSIKVNLEDLERTGEKGYVEGISNIFIKNLNDLEQHLRPLHCSDAKREILYIKDNNEWIKEKDDKPILIKAIKTIAHENVKQIKAWTEKYPDCIKSNSNKNDTYLRIVSNAMNGLTDEESINNIHKVISNISKEVTIDKNLVSSLSSFKK